MKPISIPKIILVLFILFALLTMMLSFRNPEPKQKVELTQSQWVTHLKKMGIIRDYLDRSNLPHQDVLTIEADLDAFCGEIAKQLAAQQQKDTVKKK